MKSLKYYILFIPLLIILIHGLVPHSHAPSSSHATICQGHVSFIHKFYDLLSVDIGLNHLENYLSHQFDEEELNINPFPFLLIPIFNGVSDNIPLHSYFRYSDTFIFKIYLRISSVSRRGPPYRFC